MANTETWLQSDSESVIEDMCPEGYLYVGLSRKSARGGGVGVIHRSTYDLHKISTDAYETFEHNCVLLKSSSPILLTIVYRPPPSNKNKFTVTKFIEKFEILLSELVTKHQRLCILGDFNFHWGNQNEKSAKRSMELLDMFDLTQNVKQATHRSNNILDLVITSRLIAIAGLIKVFLIQHQSRFQITTSITSNDDGDGYVFGGAGLSSATI